MQTKEAKVIRIEDDKDINNKMGEFLREIREFRGMSQHDVGISIGLSEDIAQQQIYKYEKGIIRIPVNVTIKIAKAFNIEVIIDGDNVIFIPH